MKLYISLLCVILFLTIAVGCSKENTFNENNLPPNIVFDPVSNLPYDKSYSKFILRTKEIRINLGDGKITCFIQFQLKNKRIDAEINLGNIVTIITDVSDSSSSYITYKGNHLNGLTLHTHTFMNAEIVADIRSIYVF